MQECVHGMPLELAYTNAHSAMCTFIRNQIEKSVYFLIDGGEGTVTFHMTVVL